MRRDNARVDARVGGVGARKHTVDRLGGGLLYAVGVISVANLTDESGRELDGALRQGPHSHDPKVIRLRNVVEFRFNV